MSVSSWDDYPIHQTAEYIRHPATSDRNFYDRYYFNLHGSSDEVMTIFGLGQYPNLGVTDAFIAVGTKDKHRVIRASRPLHDRSDLKVGPISIEILDPLKSLRVRCEANEWGIDLDVTWTASHHPLEEPRQYLRREGKVVFDTTKPDGVLKKTLDSSLISSLNWSPKVDLDDGLKRTYEWYREINNKD